MNSAQAMEDPFSSPYSTSSLQDLGGPMNPYQGQPAPGPVELNVMLDDVSRQMAMSNLNRRRSSRQSVQTSSTPARTPVKSARVSKIISAGSSPKSTVRRTTSTSAASTRRRTTTMHTQPPHLHTPPQLRPPPRCGRPSVRPTTWHPSSHMAFWQQSWPAPDMYQQGFANQWGLGMSTGDGAPNEPSTPSMYSCSDAISPFIPTSPLTNPFDLNEQEIINLYGSDSAQPGGLAYPELSLQYVMSTKPETAQMAVQPTSHPSWATPVFEPLWPELSQAPFPASTISSTANVVVPTQPPGLSTDGTGSEDDHGLAAPNADGKELLGMGLYDDVLPTSCRAGRGFLGLPNSKLMGRDLSTQPATGKGLKLEETWAPPSKEGDVEGRSPGPGSEREWETLPVGLEGGRTSTLDTASLLACENDCGQTTAVQDGLLSAYPAHPAYPAVGYNPAGWI